MANFASSSFMSIGFEDQMLHLSVHFALHLVVTWRKANLSAPPLLTVREKAVARVASFRISTPETVRVLPKE